MKNANNSYIIYLYQFIYCCIYTSGKKKLCITKKPIKDQYQNKIY